MIRLTKDRKHCVGCGNCSWWFKETKRFWIDDQIIIKDHEWNGKTEKMINSLVDRCYLDLITKEEIPDELEIV